MTDRNESTEKRTHLQDAQRQTSRARLKFDRVRHGLINLPREQALREWQTALLGYRSEIERYRLTKNLEEVWYEDISEALDLSLDDVGEYVFVDEEVEADVMDPATMRKTTRTRTQPLLYEPEELRQIKSQLDKCLHELGFDEPPKTIRQEGGTIKDAAEEELPGFDDEEVDQVLDQLDKFVDEQLVGSESATGEIQEEEESSRP
jgi:hypothetical protein